MPSATEAPAPAGPGKAGRLAGSFERWNRKLHFYSGLFLIFFLWLFAFTGLLLNHPKWTFHESWTNRHETHYEHAIKAPAPDLAGDLARAQDIMRQLGIVGDILWTTTRTDSTPFDFQGRRPGHVYFIKVDWPQGTATVASAGGHA